MVRRVSRRRLLAGSVPAAVALAGCSGDGDASGDDGDGASPGPNDEGTDAPDDGTPTAGGTATETPEHPLVEFPTLSSGDPTYRRWQPGTGDLRGVQTAAHNFAYAREFRSDAPAGEYEDATTWAMFNGYVGVEFEELDGFVVGLSSQAAVYVGTFGRADVTDRLGATPYERFETAEGADYYRWDRSSGTTFVAVGDEGVLAGPARQGADDPARAFVEGTVPLFATAAGDRPRLHEESTTYERYTDELGWPLSVRVGPPRPGDGSGDGPGAAERLPGGSAVPEDVAASVRVGSGRYAAGDELVDRYWLWTTEDGPAGPDTVRATYDDPEVRAAALDGVEDGELAVRRAGRVVGVVVQELVSDQGGGRKPPLVAVDATVESGTLTLEHFAGDPLPLSLVSVRGAGDPISLGEGELTPGESVSVDVPGDAENLLVVYAVPAGDATTVIAGA